MREIEGATFKGVTLKRGRGLQGASGEQLRLALQTRQLLSGSRSWVPLLVAVCPLGPENTATSGLFAASGEEERLPKLNLVLAADLGLWNLWAELQKAIVSDQVSSH